MFMMMMMTALLARSPIIGATRIRLDWGSGNDMRLMDQGGISFARPVCSGFCGADGRRYVTGIHPERPGAPRCRMVRPKRGVLCLLHRRLRQPGQSLRATRVVHPHTSLIYCCRRDSGPKIVLS
jgi:hypothetical protein